MPEPQKFEAAVHAEVQVKNDGIGQRQVGVHDLFKVMLCGSDRGLPMHIKPQRFRYFPGPQEGCGFVVYDQ